MRFIAAIPNYNAAENLPQLLQSCIKLGFDEIFVLDDASTDNSLEVLKEFSTNVTVITGTQNLGPAGNRNRILGSLRQNDTICFIDADMEVLSSNFKSQAMNIFEQETTVGIIGGLVLNKQHEPMTFNYGYFASAWRDSIGSILENTARLIPFLRPLLVPLSRPFTYNVSIRYQPPAKLRPDWVSEAFCIMRGDVFREVGGFDERLRYHEGQKIARQFYTSGYRVLFYPEIHARHLEIQTRPHRRTSFVNWFKVRK